MKRIIQRLMSKETEPNNWIGNAQPNTNKVDRKVRNEVFDPALKHFSKGFRPGELKEPSNQREKAIWKDTRQMAIEQVLGIIGQSKWAEHLVIRGSVSMSIWYPDTAREPRDIDFVFQPHTVKINDRSFKEFYQFLQNEIKTNSVSEVFVFAQEDISSDGIWTYERADGRRLSIPWKRQGIPDGEVQIDIVFGEKLTEPPVDLIVPTISGRYQFLSASKELSLAWKILWLSTDMHPQGKDLYDAVLLAEDPATDLATQTLRTVLENCEEYSPGYLAELFSSHAEIYEWQHFTNDYPEISCTPKELVARLNRAIKPQLTDLGFPPPE